MGHFTSESLTGDGSIVAEITSFSNPTSPGALSGLMIRNDTSQYASNFGIYLTPSNGVEILWRDSTANVFSGCDQVAGISGPVWLKLTRAGNDFSAYYSTDGATWIQVGTTQTIAMNKTLQAGMAVSSCDNDAENLYTATFEHVAVTQSTDFTYDNDIGGRPERLLLGPRPGLPRHRRRNRHWNRRARTVSSTSTSSTSPPTICPATGPSSPRSIRSPTPTPRPRPA